MPAAARYYVFLALGLILLLAPLAGFSLYERVVLGEYRLGIGTVPLYTPYYLARLLIGALVAAAFVALLYRARADGASIDRPALSRGKQGAAYAMIVFAALCTVLFVVDPVQFYEIGLEDGALEWLSALLPLGCSIIFVYAFIRVLRSDHHEGRGLALTMTALFAIVFFVMGMEEISWMQRVFKIATPAIFEGNQQQEMNLHNMHSIAFGTVHRVAVFTGLIVLPFLAETAPRLSFVEKLQDFLPSRFVLVISAPLAAFDYNTWNFFLAPLMVFLALAILAAYAAAARRRGDVEKSHLFVALFAFVVVGQIVYLAFGHRLVRMWDISEYRELLMAIGLAVFTWETAARLRARFRSPHERLHALPA